MKSGNNDLEKQEPVKISDIEVLGLPPGIESVTLQKSEYSSDNISTVVTFDIDGNVSSISTEESTTIKGDDADFLSVPNFYNTLLQRVFKITGGRVQSEEQYVCKYYDNDSDKPIQRYVIRNRENVNREWLPFRVLNYTYEDESKQFINDGVAETEISHYIYAHNGNQKTVFAQLWYDDEGRLKRMKHKNDIIPREISYDNNNIALDWRDKIVPVIELVSKGFAKTLKGRAELKEGTPERPVKLSNGSVLIEYRYY